MKKTASLITAVLAAVTALSIAMCAFASFTTDTIFKSGKYYHQDRFKDYDMAQGIDVSNHNDTIDWAKVKAAGVEFVIIRIGCRGYGSGGTLLEDTKYKEYLEGAHEQGLDIGVYFYSQALNTTEAKEEANFVMKRIKPYKDYITLPVYYDYEFATYSGRLDTAWRNGKLNKAKMTENAVAFCTVAEENGYEAGVYASEYFFYDNLNYEELEEKYSIWLAHYTDNTDYKGDFDLWQFSEKGTVSGINGYVDSNFRYYFNHFDVAPIAPLTYTGEVIRPEPEITFKKQVLVKDKDYLLSYQNNKEIGTAKITVRGINDYHDVPPEIISFDIIPQKVKGLTVTKQTAGSVSLSWTPYAGSIGGYQVWYKTDGTWKRAGSTKDTAFTVKGLKGAKKYYFKVRAFQKKKGVTYFGAYSAAKASYTKPKKVTNISTAAITSSSITLEWETQPLVTGYAIYQFNPETEKYEYIKTVKGTKNTYKRTGLEAGTAYYFKIKPIMKLSDGTVYKGALSNYYKEFTAPLAPEVKAVTSPKSQTVKVTWKQTKKTSGYEVMWSTSKKFSYNFKYISVASGNHAATLNTAQSGITYYVRMRSYKTYKGVRHYSSWSKTYAVIVE